MLQQVELVRGKVVEKTASGNVWLQAPRQIMGVIVEVWRWHCKTYLYIDNLADDASVDKFFNSLEIG